ncbi:TetR/AcrR family transcriptional regulator [Cohnella cholangitidis]|uniref:TetR/AcrR family transcriptional regulator n=1 Tax=Cohnella cholangitidis TaxID=2598458 RepID=A0A7G5C261_9BACL|nr:TetR/AcrR family transcriptional regulator [Cohnella cholangitidis]QMV43295.1 TetR/AcrR family transcriptional regulator [Cohnella cholangitidis]
MSPKEEVAASRKDQIINSAAALFASQGYYKTTTAHVAEDVGVTQPYVFHFFKSKEQLYLAVLDRAFTRMMNAFFSIEAPPEELSIQMGRAFNVLLESHRNEMLLLMQSFTTPEPSIRDFVKDKYSEIYDRILTRFQNANVPNPSWAASTFISCGLIVTLSEVLELPKLSPWFNDLD